MDKSHKAKELLIHYMRLVARASGVGWHYDNEAELRDLVDAIIDAAADEGAKRALRALPASVQE